MNQIIFIGCCIFCSQIFKEFRNIFLKNYLKCSTFEWNTRQMCFALQFYYRTYKTASMTWRNIIPILPPVILSLRQSFLASVLSNLLTLSNRSSPSWMFFKIGVLSTKKETPTQVFSCQIYEILKNNYFYRLPLVPAPEPGKKVRDKNYGKYYLNPRTSRVNRVFLLTSGAVMDFVSQWKQSKKIVLQGQFWISRRKLKCLSVHACVKWTSIKTLWYLINVSKLLKNFRKP